MIWSLYSATVVTILTIWLCLSVAAQRRNFRYRQFDALDLLPNGRFFAPRPISFDYFIYVRFKRGDGATLDWQPLHNLAKPWWCFIWNPQHRLRKASSDIVKLFRRTKRAGGEVQLSHPYLLILNAATSSGSSNDVTDVQFLLTRAASFESPQREAIFLSEFHPIKN